ncbi:hypothetical protein CHLRE_07g348150v5 [Chlamydomonas reinhardtii]|uniref:Uncharacterized protein n=1 Tax=Chlamydomonas reinhardtii TaxID=3055 RepID=A8IU10_CHLRE|nr:uncharacterized protein CHLRE_07g348150v5 [Chlamydomonas reinhardtii]PNW81247.1 hypothetical protein CHLRE_07g348150v5 [Chlamydomonas reinhardtii]|eukprot:XP_001692456.1 predicted protein [Chlamydomonas reinhardtii]
MEGLNAGALAAPSNAVERRRVRLRRDGHGGEGPTAAAAAAAGHPPHAHHAQHPHRHGHGEPEDLDLEPEPSERRQKATAAGGMSDFERVLMGRVTLAELQQRGVALPPEQLDYLRRVRGGC